MLYQDLASLVRTDRHIVIYLGTRPLDLDLSYKHDRAYAAKLLLNIQYPQSDIDEMLFQRFIRPGDLVLDAGANIGFTALQMLDCGAAKIVALEPVPEIYQRLKPLCDDRLIGLQTALSGSAGQALLTLSKSHNQGSSLKQEMRNLFPSVFPASTESIEVELTTIDDLISEYGAFDVWKLDIEGAEVDALAGAQYALKHAPPRSIIVELYEPFRDAFHAAANNVFPYAYRAYIGLEGYELILTDWKTDPSAAVYNTSPMYVFSREKLG